MKLACLAVICLGLAACTRPTQAEGRASKTEVPAGKPANPLEIKASTKLLEMVKTGAPQWADVGATLTVAATIVVDERRVTRVGSQLMGRVTTLLVQSGEQVSQGQLLATLNSTGLSNAQLELLKSLSRQQVAQRSTERAEILVKAGVIGSAELQRRQAEAIQMSAEVDASRAELALLGTPNEVIDDVERSRVITSQSRITASMAGTILDTKIALGQVAQTADTAFDIADLSSVWLVADVPAPNAGHLHVGQSVEAEVASFPGKLLRGTLSFVAATVNPETRTVRARMDLPNAERLYKPSMLATMTLTDQTERRLVIPTTAVVREDDRSMSLCNWTGIPSRFGPSFWGDEHGDRRVLLDGIREGEKIVLDGAFHLNNERLRLLVRGNGEA